MAKVEYGDIITELRGSIGGITFQQNRSGKIARLRPSTLKNSTVLQNEKQTAFSSLQNSWSALSSANKALWNTFADTYTRDDRWGDTVTLSGQNWFLSINSFRELLGLSMLTTPPVHSTPTAVPSFDVTVTGSSIEIDYASSWGSSDDGMMIYSTFPMRGSTTSFRSAMRLTKVIDQGPFDDYDLTSDWENTFDTDLASLQYDGSLTFGVLIQTIKRDSGISSVAGINTGAMSSTGLGIGKMVIGSTFIVR